MNYCKVNIQLAKCRDRKNLEAWWVNLAVGIIFKPRLYLNRFYTASAGLNISTGHRTMTVNKSSYVPQKLIHNRHSYRLLKGFSCS